MEWLNRLNAVIVYLEEHLEDEIDLTRMAQIACCSPFHFQRMFSYLAERISIIKSPPPATWLYRKG